MHVFEYVCKTCLKELGNLLKGRETFETSISQQKPKVAIMLNFMNSKLAKMTGKDKQNHIFQKK